MSTAVFIPPGFEYLEGNIKSGLVISNPRCGEFVFVPIDELTPNGTLDGKTFNQKFGMRALENEQVFFGENDTREFKAVLDGVNKYGGFYISRYEISMKCGTTCSIKGEIPIHMTTYNAAIEYAKKVYSYLPDAVSSHLIYEAEYDTTKQWLVDMGHKEESEVNKDSSSWGNYMNNEYSNGKLMVTGSNEKYKAGNIYDLAGNLGEWTVGNHKHNIAVIRGLNWLYNGVFGNISYRSYELKNVGVFDVGVRVALTLK